MEATTAESVAVAAEPRQFEPRCSACPTTLEEAKYKVPLKDQPGNGPIRWRCSKCHTSAMRGQRQTEPRSVHTLEELDRALEEADGNRETAGQFLGLTYKQMNQRIQNNPMLREKWNRQAMNQRKVEKVREEKGLAPVPVKTTLSDTKQALIEAQSQLLARRNKLWIRIEKIERRIEEGEEAKWSSDPTVTQRSFAKNTRGDLVEESLLREQLTALIQLDLEIQKEARETFWTFFKMEHMTATGRDLHKNGSIKRAKAGFAPKGQVINA